MVWEWDERLGSRVRKFKIGMRSWGDSWVDEIDRESAKENEKRKKVLLRRARPGDLPDSHTC